MRIYLDNCCYNRLFDDKTQERVQIESDALKAILINKKDIIVGSHFLKFEISKINDIGKRLNVMALYTQAIDETVSIDSKIIDMAKEIVDKSSIHELDALHLASAIIAGVEVFLTVDDKLIKACDKLKLDIKVINPVNIKESEQSGRSRRE